MDLSIVILHSNTPKDVEMCLRSLRQARLPAQTEIIVINNRINGANDLVPKDAWTGLDVRFLETDVDGYIYGGKPFDRRAAHRTPRRCRGGSHRAGRRHRCHADGGDRRAHPAVRGAGAELGDPRDHRRIGGARRDRGEKWSGRTYFAGDLIAVGR